jgi:SPP1 family predicted phage head-tail adaptor
VAIKDRSFKASGVGDLRHRIVIESVTEISDGQGGQDRTWATHATVWASVVPKSGDEYRFAERLEARTTDEIIIRDLPTLNEKMRIQFKGRILQIKSVDRFENNKKFFMKLKCTDKVGS